MSADVGICASHAANNATAPSTPTTLPRKRANFGMFRIMLRSSVGDALGEKNLPLLRPRDSNDLDYATGRVGTIQRYRQRAFDHLDTKDQLPVDHLQRDRRRTHAVDDD